jgi:hypothetical protein
MGGEEVVEVGSEEAALRASAAKNRWRRKSPALHREEMAGWRQCGCAVRTKRIAPCGSEADALHETAESGEAADSPVCSGIHRPHILLVRVEERCRGCVRLDGVHMIGESDLFEWNKILHGWKLVTIMVIKIRKVLVLGRTKPIPRIIPINSGRGFSCLDTRLVIFSTFGPSDGTSKGTVFLSPEIECGAKPRSSIPNISDRLGADVIHSCQPNTGLVGTFDAVIFFQDEYSPCCFISQYHSIPILLKLTILRGQIETFHLRYVRFRSHNFTTYTSYSKVLLSFRQKKKENLSDPSEMVVYRT